MSHAAPGGCWEQAEENPHVLLYQDRLVYIPAERRTAKEGRGRWGEMLEGLQIKLKKERLKRCSGIKGQLGEGEGRGGEEGGRMQVRASPSTAGFFN